MAEREIYTTTVNVPESGVEITAYLAKPDDTGSYPGVVVLQEIFGVNTHIREVTERIAREGYVAIAPALFQRIAPGFETAYTAADIEIGRNYAWNQTSAPQLLGDIQATINYLKTLPNVQGDSIGCIGFCFGGHVAYLAATLNDIKATASFYGAGIPLRTPGGGESTLTRTPDIPGIIYLLFGNNDASIPPEHVQQIAAKLEKYNIAHRIFRYDGADHGFFCDHRASYNPEAAIDAWEKVKQLFSSELAQ